MTISAIQQKIQQTMNESDRRYEDACPKCNGTGYLPQPKELDRFYSRQRCTCHPDYVAETERLRAYS